MSRRKADCPHHWVIETPGTNKVFGVYAGKCKLCGAKREHRPDEAEDKLIAGFNRQPLNMKGKEASLKHQKKQQAVGKMERRVDYVYPVKGRK